MQKYVPLYRYLRKSMVICISVVALACAYVVFSLHIHDLGAQYSKNFYTVYYRGQPLFGADAGTFWVAAPESILIKDPKYVPLAAESAPDMRLDESYAADVHTVYVSGVPLAHSDGKTFMPLWHGFYEDAHQVYSPLEVGADEATPVFTVFDRDSFSFSPVGYAHDNRSIYTLMSGHVMTGIDPASFQPLSARYVRNVRGVYYVPLEGSEVLPVEGSDMATFSPIGESIFGKDRYAVFAVGKKIVADVTSFTVLVSDSGNTSAYALDMHGAQYADTAMPAADAGTLQVYLDVDYAHDAKHVYYRGVLLPQADVHTFTAAYQAEDAVHYFDAGVCTMKVGGGGCDITDNVVG